MNITVTGATGLIGTALIGRLLKAGHHITALGRYRRDHLPGGVRFSFWDAIEGEPLRESIVSADAIIHLAGHSIAERWTPEVKALIRDSRVLGTRCLVNAIAAQNHRPEVLVCASTVRFYGSRGDEILTESSRAGSDFLATVAVELEQAAETAELMGIRVIRLRLATVLSGGAPAYLVPFRFVKPASSGQQWISWIHIDDVCNLILFALKNRWLRGSVNASSPNPVTNAEFMRELAKATGRPGGLTVPGSAITRIFGDMASLVFDSQRVNPLAAEAAGFHFQYVDFREALKDLVRS